VLDTARFTNSIAETLAVPVKSVKALTLGSHGDTMVPVPSRCTVDGKPLADLLPAEKIEELVVRTRNGGAEVVALLKTGSAYYAPVRRRGPAWPRRSSRTPARPFGLRVGRREYGISGVYLGVEARSAARHQEGRRGEADRHELAVSGAAEAVRAKQADVANL
jgi:malate dehydrogenase